MFGIRNYWYFYKKKKMLNRAYEIIEITFADKLDKGGNPYVFHPIKVCELVKLETNDVEVWIIALLHDLFEDCGDEWTADILRSEGFSERVIKGVDLLTKKPNQTYSEYVFQLTYEHDARVVKKAGLKHNMDITRLPKLDKDVYSLLKRYHSSYKKLVFFEENGYHL